MASNRIGFLLLALLPCLAAESLGCGGSFDEAPPTLPFYLHRLPAKSLEEIYGETLPRPNGKGWGDYQNKLPALAEELQTKTAAELLPEIDHLLELAHFDANASAELFNLLHDLHDAFAVAAPQGELAAYVRWRCAHADWFGLSWRNEPRERRSRWDDPKVPGEEAVAIEQQLAAASPALRPQWLYLRGALGFKSGEDTESQRWFERVLAEAPQSPRAESALFMDARCQLSRARTYSEKPEDQAAAAANRPRARELFGKCLQKYPHGILAADALGWLGAIAYDAGDYAGALRSYITQTELPSHPEIRPSAVLMCEKTLSHIASAPNDNALREVALHPQVAMGLIYLIVNTSEADNFNGEEDDPAELRKWRQAILPRLASAVAREKRSFQDPIWQPRFLAILAYAASGVGRQDEALQLSESASATRNDDLLFARAVAWQRAGKFAEAIAAYREFRKNFPRSPLARGAQLRLALTLQDDHQAGEAILALEELNQPNEASDYDDLPPPDLSGAEPAQVRQLIDTLRNFAPLPELVAVVRRTGLVPASRIEFNETLAQRYLAREDFAEAKKYLTPAQWALTAEKIESLTAAANGEKTPAERAKICAELGDSWAATRGKLFTYPLDAEKLRREVFGDDAAAADVQRSINAKALGLDAQADAEMENRDELRHAFAWWRQAATPASLWHALEAIPAIADVSPYTRQRAVATNAGAVSRQIYAQLRHDFPDSREARELAVYWNFPDQPAALRTRWSSNRTSDSADTAEDERRWVPIVPRVLALEREAAEWEPAKFQAEVAELAQQAHALQRTINAAFWINYLDDLQTFLQEPDPGAAVRARYVALRAACLRQSVWGYWPEAKFNGQDQVDAAGNRIDRDAQLRSQIALALADPTMQPVRDYLAFLDLAVVANHLISVPFVGMPGKDGEPYLYRTRDYPLLENMTAKFLAEFPKSRKREAALLLHARAIFMESKPEVVWQEILWPESGRWDYAEAERTQEQTPFAADRIVAALDAYDQEYPRGQYAAEIRDFRADVGVRQRAWGKALDMTLAQLHDEAHPSLQPAAQDRLDRLFVRLLQPADRAELLRAIKASAPARAALLDFLKREEAENPLAELTDYLTAQLAEVL